MIIQYKTVFKVTFLVIFLISPILKSQQLALPKNKSVLSVTSTKILICCPNNFQLSQSECGLHRGVDGALAFSFPANMKKLLENITDNLSYSIINFSESAIFGSSQDFSTVYGYISYSLDGEGRINKIQPYYSARVSSPESYYAVIKGMVLQNIFYDLAVGKNYKMFKAERNLIPKINLLAFLDNTQDRVIECSYLKNRIEIES